MPNLIFSLFLFALFSMLLVIRQRQQICQTKKTNLKKASITCTLHVHYRILGIFFPHFSFKIYLS